MSEFHSAATATATTNSSVRKQMEYLKGNATKTVELNINQASANIQTGNLNNPLVYSQTCMILGSAIDSAIALNAVPSSSHLLKLLSLTVREVYRRKTSLQLPSLMLLMLPIKAACQIGWFPDGDKDDLLMMAKEVSKGLSDTDKMSIEPRYAHFYVSNIISRFYPTMKVESTLTSFDVKAGYGTFVVDFHISQGTLPRHCRNLWLIVARMDNMDTSACIASPSNVDFLINGSGVPKRTKGNMGKGPQLPSDVTKMIKYGVNLLQVLGEFDGHYIITVAFMNPKSSPDIPILQDYVHTMSGVVDFDCNVNKPSSLISLDCPISKLRIRIPVKGHLCKHHQCFDYNYFMQVNSRWPTWNCPICNKPVCNLDIRIDRNFVKILNEVAGDASDVIIAADGSWTVAMKTNNQTIETSRKTITQNNHVPNSLLASQSSHSTVQSQQGQTDRTTQPDVGPSTTDQAQSTSSPRSVALAFEQLKRGGEQGDYSILDRSQPDAGTTKQAQSATMFTPPASRYETPVGRMRGSLKGNELAAARDRLLAPPQQPARANEPWSRPTPTLPMPFLTQRTTTNSDNTQILSRDG